MHTFEVKDEFYIDGKPVKIISGGIHYFRIVPEYWRDRLEKLKAMGCNTVETYVPWNMHEPKKGQFNFSGMLDIERFIKTAQELGLYVIVRPSPYICAEWEFGGLPAWLLKEDGMRLRGCYEPYLKHVKEYYDRLFQILTPLQITKGGPVIMFQVENEYGYYGDDTEYTTRIRQKYTIYLIKDAIIDHNDPPVANAIFSPRTFWKLYYTIRNKYLIAHRYNRGIKKAAALFLLTGSVAWQVVYSLIRKGLGKYRFLRLKMVMKGFWDGLRCRNGKSVDPVEFMKRID